MAGYRTYGASGDGTQGYGGRTLKELADMVHGSKAEFVRRLEDPARAHIRDWDPGRHGTASFKLAWTDGGDGRAYVYPMVQEVDGELVDFTDPEVQRARMADPQLGGWLNALESGDYVEMTPEEAEHFTNHYKEWYRGGDSWGANPADADYDIDLSWLGGDPKNARYLNYAMRKLLRMGYGGAQVAALLGSMAEESGGDPYAVGDGGLAEGLLQWHPDRYRTSVLSDADPFMEIDRQLAYLDKSLRSSDDTVSWTHGGAGSGYRTAKEAMDDWAAARDLWHAVRALTYGYVRPKDAAARAGSRYRLADRILAELAERKWAREGKEFDRELSERRAARLKMRGELEEKLRDSPLLPVPEKDGVAQEQPQPQTERSDALDHNLDDPYTMVGIPSGTEWSLWDSDAAQREWAGSIGLPDQSGLHRSGGRLARRHGDGGEKGGGAFDAQGMQREWAAQLGLPDYSQADYATEPYSDADATYGGTLQPAGATAKMTREDVANAVRGGNVTLDWVARNRPGDYSWVQAETSGFQQGVRDAINKAAPVVGGVLAGAAAAPYMIGPMAANPISTALGFAGYDLTDEAVDRLSRGRYGSWGEWVASPLRDSEWYGPASFAAGFTNPGALLGGFAGHFGDRAVKASLAKRMHWHEADHYLKLSEKSRDIATDALDPDGYIEMFFARHREKSRFVPPRQKSVPLIDNPEKFDWDNFVTKKTHRAIRPSNGRADLSGVFFDSPVETGYFDIIDMETGKTVEGYIPDYTGSGADVIMKRPDKLSFNNLYEFEVTNHPYNANEATAADALKLRNVTQKNIDFLERYIPGARAFGSSRLVANGDLTHITHDYDFVISEQDFKAFKAKHPEIRFENSPYNPETFTFSSKETRGMPIDLNVVGDKAAAENIQKLTNSSRRINLNKNKGAKITRFEELFRQQHPDAYKDYIVDIGRGAAPQSPVSPRQLLDEMDPEVKSIIDQLEINAVGGKSKHLQKPALIISQGDSEKVRAALEGYAKVLFGERQGLLPYDDTFFSNVEANKAFLEKIGLDRYKDAIAVSPSRMRNAVDFWFLSNTGFSRGITANIAGKPAAEAEKLINDMLTKWRGSAADGARHIYGLNGVLTGDSAIPAKSGGIYLYGYKQLGDRAVAESSDLNSLYENVMKYTGRGMSRMEYIKGSNEVIDRMVHDGAATVEDGVVKFDTTRLTKYLLDAVKRYGQGQAQMYADDIATKTGIPVYWYNKSLYAGSPFIPAYVSDLNAVQGNANIMRKGIGTPWRERAVKPLSANSVENQLDAVLSPLRSFSKYKNPDWDEHISYNIQLDDLDKLQYPLIYRSRYGASGEKKARAIEDLRERINARQLKIYKQANADADKYDVLYQSAIDKGLAASRVASASKDKALGGGALTFGLPSATIMIDELARTGNGNPESAERIALYAASHPEYKDYIGKDGKVDLSELRRKAPALFDKLMAETDAELTASTDANGDPLANMYATGGDTTSTGKPIYGGTFTPIQTAFQQIVDSDGTGMEPPLMLNDFGRNTYAPLLPWAVEEAGNEMRSNDAEQHYPSKERQEPKLYNDNVVDLIKGFRPLEGNIDEHRIGDKLYAYRVNVNGEKEHFDTIGSGLVLKDNLDVLEKYNSQVDDTGKHYITVAQNEQFWLDKYLNEALPRAKRVVDAQCGAGTFDSLPDAAKAMFADYSFNLGNNFAKFKNFIGATVLGDHDAMLKEYVRKAKGARLGVRNDYFRAYIDKYFPAPVRKQFGYDAMRYGPYTELLLNPD